MITKEIPNTGGVYFADDRGCIYSQKRNTTRGGALKQQRVCGGYMKVELSINGIRSTKLVHRLVAEAFIPNPLQLPEVNHKDGNKNNNSVSNLEWCDRFYNQKHRFQKLGHKPPNRKLRKGDVFFILSTKEITRKKIAEMLGVSKVCVDCIKSGKTYKEYFVEFNRIK